MDWWTDDRHSTSGQIRLLEESYQIRCFNYLKKMVALKSIVKSNHGTSNILREKSFAIYFGDSQFRRNRTFNFILVSKIYVC